MRTACFKPTFGSGIDFVLHLLIWQSALKGYYENVYLNTSVGRVDRATSRTFPRFFMCQYKYKCKCGYLTFLPVPVIALFMHAYAHGLSLGPHTFQQLDWSFQRMKLSHHCVLLLTTMHFMHLPFQMLCSILDSLPFF